jgi:hypothetical protein
MEATLGLKREIGSENSAVVLTECVASAADGRIGDALAPSESTSGNARRELDVGSSYFTLPSGGTRGGGGGGGGEACGPLSAYARAVMGQLPVDAFGALTEGPPQGLLALVRFGLLKGVRNETCFDVTVFISFSLLAYENEPIAVLIPLIRAGETFSRPMFIPREARLGAAVAAIREDAEAPMCRARILEQRGPDREELDGAVEGAGSERSSLATSGTAGGGFRQEAVLDCGQMRDSMTLLLYSA